MGSWSIGSNLLRGGEILLESGKISHRRCCLVNLSLLETQGYKKLLKGLISKRYLVMTKEQVTLKKSCKK